MKKLKQISLAVAGLLLPAIVSAQEGLIPPPPTALGGRLANGSTTATDIALYFIDLALLIVGIIAVGFIIIGGFRYITSAGNEEVAGEAKKTILNAIIGLVIAILSYVIIAVISNALIGNV